MRGIMHAHGLPNGSMSATHNNGQRITYVANDVPKMFDPTEATKAISEVHRNGTPARWCRLLRLYC